MELCKIRSAGSVRIEQQRRNYEHGDEQNDQKPYVYVWVLVVVQALCGFTGHAMDSLLNVY